ncbi:MAG: hypothetical protein AAF066_18375, partial [Pseudomonadota bacterium]
RQDLSCTAANGQSLIEKALAPHSRRYFLRSQHVVFPQNRREADLRRTREMPGREIEKQTLAAHAKKLLTPQIRLMTKISFTFAVVAENGIALSCFAGSSEFRIPHLAQIIELALSGA